MTQKQGLGPGGLAPTPNFVAGIRENEKLTLCRYLPVKCWPVMDR